MTEACMNIHIHLCTHVRGDEIMVKHKLVYFDNMIIMVEKMNPFPIMLIPLYSCFFLKNVHHQLLEFTQTHFHRVSDAIGPSNPTPRHIP